MEFKRYPVVKSYFYGLGVWIIADIKYRARDGKVKRIMARGKFINALAAKLTPYDGDIASIRFKLISLPFEIIDADTEILLKPRDVYIDWDNRIVRFDFYPPRYDVFARNGKRIPAAFEVSGYGKENNNFAGVSSSKRKTAMQASKGKVYVRRSNR